MKKLSLGAALALMGITAAVTVSITYVYAMNNFNGKVADVNERQAQYAMLGEIDQKVRQEYIGEIDETKLRNGIAAGYLAGLGDAQGKYLTAEKYKEYRSAASGKSVGVGVQTVQDGDGNMLVASVFPGSPGEAAGLKKGDVIVAVDGKEVVRLTYGEAVPKLEGAAGAKVELTVLRPGEDGDLQKQDLSVTLAEYTARSVISETINGNVGYLRISSFQEQTAVQFNEAVSTLVNQGVAGLVIDLRGNAGGDMEAMASALDTLLPSGVTVSYRDKQGKVVEQYRSKANEIALPIAVLADENTYGAAELFAANVKDYKKGLLVGKTTAGYGRKDEAFALSDGSAVIVSVADYLRLGGASFTGKGIAPDVEKELTAEQAGLFSRYELAPADDPQLLAAVSALARQGAQVQQLPGSTVSSQPEAAPGGEGSSAAAE